MLITEVADIDSSAEKLSALCQFLIGRATDTDSAKKISTTAFINLAAGMGINLTLPQLQSMIQKPPLSNFIENIEGDTILFKGSDEAPVTMSVDQARMTVDNMAKRAAKKDL